MIAWPRTFFARNLILILGMFFVAQIGTWVLFVGLVQRPRLEHFAPYIVAQTHVLRLALRDHSPMERANLVASIKRDLGHKLRLRVAAPVARPLPSEWLVRWFFSLLRPQLATGQSLAWQSAPHRVLWVRTPIDSRLAYWVGFPAEGFVPTFSDAALALLVVSILVALVGAGLIQFGLIPPLKALEAAALRVGEGTPALVLSGSMPIELERVAMRFNQMQEKLGARDRERALMLAGISHDLRTPLAKLWLGLEMLNGKADTDLLERMTRSVQTAERIIGQFIDFARDGDSEPMIPCDLIALMSETVSEAMENPTWVHCHWGAIPACLARPTALRRILGNLVENAVRYGRPPITVEGSWDKDYLHLQVTDHGTVASEAELLTWTQPFVRGRPPVSGPQGTGLGLAIVARLAQAHGGSLALDRADTGGLRATVRLRARAV